MNISINQQLIVGGERIPYVVRYSKKAKHLQLKISQARGVELIIPKQYSLKDGEKFIEKRKEWIKKHYVPAVREDAYYFLGKKIKVIQSYSLFIKKHKMRFSDGTLYLESPNGSYTTALELYSSFLRYMAKKYIPKRVTELAEKNGFSPSRINIRGQKTRWGSCSSKGHLSFNFKLMMYRREIIDYVIIHELCHLREMNHSGRFWSLVSRYSPDYKGLKNELKRLPV